MSIFEWHDEDFGTWNRWMKQIICDRHIFIINVIKIVWITVLRLLGGILNTSFTITSLATITLGSRSALGSSTRSVIGGGFLWRLIFRSILGRMNGTFCY